VRKVRLDPPWRIEGCADGGLCGLYGSLAENTAARRRYVCGVGTRCFFMIVFFAGSY